MTTVILVLFALLNILWGFIAYILQTRPGSEVVLFGFQTGFEPRTYILPAILALIVVQVFLIAWFLYARSRGMSFASRYKTEKAQKKELEGRVASQEQRLEGASTIEEKFAILSERAQTLEEWNTQLSSQNEQLAEENSRLLKAVEREMPNAEKGIMDKIQSFFLKK